MARNLNVIAISGNLTRDPEIRFMPSGAAVAEFGMALNKSYKDSAGTFQSRPIFLNLKAFGKTAEAVGEFLKKGSFCIVNGSFDMDTWEKDGQTRTKLYVVAFDVIFGPKPRTEEGAPASGSSLDTPGDDDIPF